MNNDTSIEQLKHFLKEMFQFNANDLDFGIYRIYNLKRKEIEHFIDGNEANCLEPVIDLTLKGVANFEKKAELASLETYLKTLNQQDLLNDIEANYKQLELFIEANNNEEEKAIQKEALKNASKEFDITDEIKDKIYNHILGYFEMYYSNGDFGYNNRSRNLYKVPYEADYDGSDTLFHWKHKGSIYIKTGNSFNAIKFKIKHLDKDFELRIETNEESTDEEVARNNNKDTKLKHYKFNRFEKKDGVTQIIFNLSDSSTTKADLFKSLFKDVFKSNVDIDKYLFAKNNKDELKPVFNDLTDDYDKVNDGAVKGIGALRVKRSTLLTKVNKNFERGSKIEIIKEKGQERFSDDTLETLYNIDQKLNSFYIGNDSDYFIHENLLGFLTQEKERYIKNHILSDLKSILDGKLDNTTIIIAKAFDLVSTRIIEFLAAIEEFQKKLFTMKKKVVESEYSLTIDNIDETYYPEILKNKAQLAEWEVLFSVKVKTLADLKAQPTLVLDTKFFRTKGGSNLFKDKVLAEIEDLDGKTNGVLISSENYQALSVMLEKYRKQVDCVHIDPPYNSKTSGFLYKNNFKHSSWLSMMENRLIISTKYLSIDGSVLCHIDENEYENLQQLFQNLKFPYLGVQVWDKKNPMMGGTGLALQHEYTIWASKHTGQFGSKSENRKIMIQHAQKIIKASKGVNAKSKMEYSKWLKEKEGLSGGDRMYKYIEDDGRVYRLVAMTWPNPNPAPSDFFIPLIHPLTNKRCPVPNRGWSRSPVKMKELLDKNEIVFGIDESTQPQRKIYLESNKNKPVSSVYSSGKKGKPDTENMGISFTYNHPVSLYEELIFASIPKNNGILLDFFAGSGTSGHAVINLNKEDTGSRKYILIEMGNYFDTITKPRIQKVIYSNNWKAGRPEDNDGSNMHIFKYQVLEQYEDVLDAIEQFDGVTPKDLPLKYLYKPELNKIESSLDLSKPFSNKIKYGQPTKVGYVDVVDTYNYLQGYEVKSLKTYTINKKYYKVVEAADTLVIWRDIALKEDDSKAIIEIAGKYPDVSAIELNYDFNLLATEKGKHLKVGKRQVSVSIIHADIFNQ